MSDNHAGETTFAGFPVDYVTTITGGGNGHKPRRRLAIVGSHPKGLNLVPWDDEDVEIWLFNEAPLRPEKYPRWDALLQIHLPEVYASENNWVNAEYWNWLQQDHKGRTVWMQEIDPRVPNSKRYPIEGVLHMLPPEFHYLRSSPAMALALGIYLKYDEIQLYGSELSSNTEYGYQATNYAFWIGLAIGRGVDLKLRCWFEEFQQPLYGYEGELQISSDWFEARIEDLQDAHNTNQSGLKRLQDRLSAAMLENDYQKVADLSIDVENAAIMTGEVAGALFEAQRYLARVDHISRQEFERTSAQAQLDGDKLRSDKDHAGGKVEYVWNVWRQTGQNAALQQVRTFIKEKNDIAYRMGEKLGIYHENLEYMLEYDTRLNAAGGVRALGRDPVKDALRTPGG